MSTGVPRERFERLFGREPSPDDDRFLEPPEPQAVESLLAGGGFELAPGTRLGGWTIRGPLAAGGMGDVYRARRTATPGAPDAPGAPDTPDAPDVAIKVLQRRLLAPALRRRFHEERRVLACLDHPAITRLLDGGETDDGRPYLVMELVDGRPVDEWCDARRADVAERVRIVRDACDAVAAAHRALVVHRDLKPSNLLVRPDGRPALLDFGIARVLERTAARDERGATTRALDLIATPEYASPEQLRGEPCTTAADVHALGAVLYRLLTGTPPPRPPGMLDARAVRRGTAPLPPAASETVAEGRVVLASGETLARRRRTLAGDLDAILGTALRADPRERYPSVEALAADLDRWREGRPIRARRLGRIARLGRVVARHRVAVASGTLALIVVLGSLVGTSLALVASRHATDRAERARAGTQQSLRFYADLLASADAFGSGRGAGVSEMLDEAEARLAVGRGRFEPGAEVGIRLALARAASGLMQWPRVARHAVAVTAMRPPGRGDARERLERADALSLLGRAETHLRVATAAARHREALAIRRALLGDERSEVAQSIGNLAFATWSGQAEPPGPKRIAEAERGYLECLARFDRLGERDTVIAARYATSLAFMYEHVGRPGEAERTYRDALARYARLGDREDVYAAVSRRGLARLLERDGRHGEAADLLRAYLDAIPSGGEAWRRLQALWALARALAAAERTPEAATTVVEAIRLELDAGD